MIDTAKKSLAIAALLAGTSALAATPDWRVSEVSGGVTVERSGKVLSARQDTTLRPGDVIRTGKKGRAVLVRGKEFVVVSPDAQLKVAVPEETGAVTQFFQYLGNALFKIEKKSTPHFGVKTPYLAAVVKGTTFNVSVGADRSSVQVTEGAVEVATGDDLEAALITPGLIGFVDADNATELLVISGSRSGEDLSGAIVRGTPEFVSKPPQARSDREDRGAMPGASGLTPAAGRANRIGAGSPALASAGQRVSLGLLDDDVSGGGSETATFSQAAVIEQSAPEAIFDDGVSQEGNQEEAEAIADPGSESAPLIAPTTGAIVGEPGLDPVAIFDPAATGEDDGVVVNPVPQNALAETEADDEVTVSDEENTIASSDDEGEVIEVAEEAVAVIETSEGTGNSENTGNSDDDDASEDTDIVVGTASGDGSDDDGGAAGGLIVGFGTGSDDDDGNNGHGNDDDGLDDSNPGNGNGGGNSAGDEADGSGVEVNIDDGGSGDVAELDFDDGSQAGDDGSDEGGNGGICLGDYCIDIRDDDDDDGRDENDDGDGRACGLILCIEGPGVDDGDDDDDIDVGEDMGIGDDDDDDDDGNNGHGNDDDGDDDSNPGKGGGHGKNGNGNGNGNGHGNGDD